MSRYETLKTDNDNKRGVRWIGTMAVLVLAVVFFRLIELLVGILSTELGTRASGYTQTVTLLCIICSMFYVYSRNAGRGIAVADFMDTVSSVLLQCIWWMCMTVYTTWRGKNTTAMGHA